MKITITIGVLGINLIVFYLLAEVFEWHFEEIRNIEILIVYSILVFLVFGSLFNCVLTWTNIKRSNNTPPKINDILDLDEDSSTLKNKHHPILRGIYLLIATLQIGLALTLAYLLILHGGGRWRNPQFVIFILIISLLLAGIPAFIQYFYKSK